MKSKQKRKRKVDFKCHISKAQWSMDYAIIKLGAKALLLFRQ